MLQQVHQLLTPAGFTGELQQRTAGGAADQRSLVVHERLDHSHHSPVGQADVTERLQQRFTGLLEAGRTRLLGTGHSRAAGQAAPQGRHGLQGAQLAKGAGGRLAQAVVFIFEGGQQLWDGWLSSAAELAEGPGGIAGHGVFLHAGAGIAGPALPQGQP